ncbi:nucleoside diphosphate kinase, putative [Entamoeba invadens IP1]|uniref:nucleoside diphosphate kinase, putative n=1 Tax=Entamoeba invadens IP1 TaxID=370355 RepID=UPI0002C3ED0F|nr:nucleoside diphosphate kinase, putative [Entamoeba invadens IP1]ELP90744.1 nucleoside diphosphate kinase, putative [Entamoeba invadens IP1]|eukprot:XP_004257515.1 nucleoside diphosphate kinase, putative [Entamoeba invadens IP1]
MQKSLVLFKPDAVCIRQAGIYALERLRKAIPNFKLLCFEPEVVPAELAKQHYAEHDGKKFFPSLIASITNPNGVVVLVIEGEDAVKIIRKELGPTFVEKAMGEDCIRGKFGITGGVNCCHASDAEESGKREVGLWTSYFKLPLDEQKAEKNYEEYKAKYDGKFQSDVTRLREIVKKIKADEEEFITEMKKMTDADDFLIKQILSAVITN